MYVRIAVSSFHFKKIHFSLLIAIFIFFLLLLLLLLLSAFPFSQGWPQRIIILHIFLSSTSVSFTPTFCISSFTASKNLLFDLPLLLFPGNSISIIFLPTYSWSTTLFFTYDVVFYFTETILSNSENF